MTTQTQDSAGRQKGVVVVKPVVYGNIARYFGKKREEDGHTHQWTVYVKPFNNEDMSAYVKKINFKLHDSYPNPNRVVTKPPYEVTETGWGEFEIIIKVYFNDPQERPVTIYHLLKLFQSETDVMLGKKSLVVEYYDEMVFQDPTVTMMSMLANTSSLGVSSHKHETDFDEKKERTINKISNAHGKIRYEIDQMNEKLKKSKDAIAKMKKEIAKLEEGVIVDGDF
ncbi:dolichyl-diphosphooligosaccharide--protein glycosyltransferase 48 kda subunit [Plakobranchus ocellatus]|uniref:YEATS domain-containing protein 4 n=1 Tax=Plakobranchus ocellatus TaxID=259542 RepID=A0AAV4BT66_9GAST|nr:dolichyl-diphosphooligosaccharide--protein glycosyltransferase 48 kda subunit [Plakobranchus ocellatus]